MSSSVSPTVLAEAASVPLECQPSSVGAKGGSGWGGRAGEREEWGGWQAGLGSGVESGQGH